MTDPIRVVLVDDDPLVRAALAQLLGGEGGIEIVGMAGDGDEALAVVAEQHPQVVLMDIRMPRRDGVSATRALLARAHPPKVIVLTTLDSDELVLKARAAGAHGFLLKDTPTDRMVEAVAAAVRGEPTLSPAVTRTVIAAATGGVSAQRRRIATDALARVTEREREVAVAIGRGLDNAQIARELFMAPATVKTYVTRLFAKLGVTNRVQVANLVHDAGLL